MIRTVTGGVPGASKNRWKVGCLKKTLAREMEGAIRTRILLRQETTERAKPILFKEQAQPYLALEEVKFLRSFVGRSHSVQTHLIPFFGGRLSEIKPQSFPVSTKEVRWNTASVQTINHDHIAFKHCLNVAIRRGLLQSNPASKVPLSNPHNKRDCVLTDEEWGKLYRAAKAHLRPVLLTAYQLGQRFSVPDDRLPIPRSTPLYFSTSFNKPSKVYASFAVG